MATQTATTYDDLFTFPDIPTIEDLEQERRFWQDLDRIAEYDAWQAIQAETQEHEYDDDCNCEDCCQFRGDSEEWDAMNREFERAVRGY